MDFGLYSRTISKVTIKKIVSLILCYIIYYFLFRRLSNSRDSLNESGKRSFNALRKSYVKRILKQESTDSHMIWSTKTKSKETIVITLNCSRNEAQKLENYNVHIEIIRKCIAKESLDETEFIQALSKDSPNYMFHHIRLQRLGPDEIFVQMEGPSLQTLVARCTDMQVIYIILEHLSFLKLLFYQGDYLTSPS